MVILNLEAFLSARERLLLGRIQTAGARNVRISGSVSTIVDIMKHRLRLLLRSQLAAVVSAGRSADTLGRLATFTGVPTELAASVGLCSALRRGNFATTLKLVLLLVRLVSVCRAALVEV